MTGIAFGPAEAMAKKVIAALAGGTGSGKTMSALELGTGLVANPARHLFLIDTEFGRAAHYANSFKFQYGQLSPPFRPDRYIEAIDASIEAGSECTIVDSLSHMWEGEDGLLDWHSDIALKMAKGNEDRAETYNFPAWRLPKQELQKFVLYLQRCPVHLILCLRAKERSKMVKAVDRDGKTRTEIVAAGLQPIIDAATPYEATFLAMLSQDVPGEPHWFHKALASYLQPIFADGEKQLSREHGRRLAQWCGNAPTPPREHAPTAEEAPEPAATTAAGTTQKDLYFRLKEALLDSPHLVALEKLWEVTLKRKDLTARTIERLRTQVYEPAKANLTGEPELPHEVPGETYDDPPFEDDDTSGSQTIFADLPEDPEERSATDRQKELL